MYSPKINPQHVRALYRLKQIVKRPMTKLVNDAITEYLNKLPIQLITDKEKQDYGNK